MCCLLLLFLCRPCMLSICWICSPGGVFVSPEEIQAAFEFLDADREGKVTMTGLKKRLQVFFPNMTTKEYRCAKIDDLSDIVVCLKDMCLGSL